MINSDSKNTEYKKRLIKIWNEIAPRYHKRWANANIGPFQSTKQLVQMAKIRPDHNVLDVACGTGVVTRKISCIIRKNGHIIGTDSSLTAIKIAKKSIKKNNVDFVISDAENLGLDQKFDVVTCQYALFFFPNAKKALQNIKQLLKKNGMLALAVHGAGNTVPYFSSIIDVIPKFIPDYIPPSTPNLDRFGNKDKLKTVVTKVGFTNIQIKEFTYWYSPGTFSKYWSDYLKYLAKPLKQKIDKLSQQHKNQMREQVRQKTIPYTKNGIIKFPWQVLILTAKNP